MLGRLGSDLEIVLFWCCFALVAKHVVSCIPCPSGSLIPSPYVLQLHACTQGHTTKHTRLDQAAPPPLVFFHISKTAGSATLKALRDSTLEARVLSEDEKRDTTLGWLNTTRPGQFVWHHSPAFSCDTDWCWSQPHVWFTIWRDPIAR